MTHDHIFASACLYIRLVAWSGRFVPSAGGLACLIALTVALLFLAPPAAGATKTWADGTGQWNTSGNWSPSGQPQAGDDVLLTQTDATTRTVTYYNTTNPTAVLKSLKIDATGTGTMTLNMPNNHALNVTTEYVGYDGKGFVTQSAGTDNAATLYLGYNAAGNGTYTLTGGTLSSSGSQYIGYAGKGTLSIQNGGQVSDAAGYLGYDVGSSGTATVTGTGSKWTDSGYLYVGRYGNGTLNIEPGGQVSNTTAYVGYYSGSTSTATVTGTGSTWTNTGSLYVGRSGSGTLTIEAGGQVSNTSGSLGSSSGSTGAATVTGTGSKWTNSGQLSIGDFGSGTLSIEKGGQVSSYSGSLGFISTGTAAVTGTGSKWTNTGSLYVGGWGSGTLTVANGGTVSTVTLHASLSDLLGNGTITAQGAVLDTDLVFDSTHGTTQTLSFGTGGRLDLTVTASGDLGAGHKGTGTLRIADGVTVASTRGYLGYNPESSGTATVTGPGSTWTNSGTFYVGRYGNATFNIEAGGQVSNTDGYLGYWGTSIYTAAVTGSGSTWTNSGSLYVSYSGMGTLTVADGGLVTAGTLYAPLSDLSGDGTITVTKGAVLDTDLVFDGTHGATQALSFGTGGKLNLTVTTTGDLGAGFRESGTLRIAEGVKVASAGGYLGYDFRSAGTATVTGNASAWSNSGYLYVGRYGDGTLNIEEGGQVSNTKGYIGYNSASTGTATVTGDGSKWTNSGILYVGGDGSGTRSGTLNILAGGQVSSTSGHVGIYLSSTGTATVKGAGSTWINSSELRVGGYGKGTLNIESGGQVSNTSGYLDGDYASGTATVTGAGSKWTNSGSLSVGYDSSGTMNIEKGGEVTSTSGYVGNRFDSTGTATVTGAGSKWTDSGELYVGYNGTGRLAVADGGKVAAKSVSVNSKSAARLHVSGSDMLVLGNDAIAGSIANSGTVNFYADAFLAAKVYTPISDCKGRAMTWSGTGSYKAYGGTWDTTAKTFTVAAATELKAGDSDTLSTGERLLFTDPGSGKRVGASFGSITGSPKFSAAMMSQDELDDLTKMPGFEGKVLSGWDFDTDFAGGDNVLLSFEIGLGAEDVGVWHYDGGVWSQYAADLVTYDAGGVLSFTVTSFSGYAVTAIPEPATFALVVGGLAIALLRRRPLTLPSPARQYNGRAG